MTEAETEYIYAKGTPAGKEIILIKDAKFTEEGLEYLRKREEASQQCKDDELFYMALISLLPMHIANRIIERLEELRDERRKGPIKKGKR